MLEFLRNTILVPLRDFIYPPVCMTCDQLLTAREEKVCTKCWNSVTGIDSHHAVWKEITGKFQTDGYVEDVLSCFLFEKEGSLQQMIHLLKYQGMKSLGVQLGREIGKRIEGNEYFSRADILVPIPLHKLKMRERGYNQSEFLCRGIADITHIPMQRSLLRRTKYTQSQTQLTIVERRENVGDAFRLNQKFLSFVKGKTIALVDDVVTTGATMNACAMELRANGAATVLAASVALAQ